MKERKRERRRASLIEIIILFLLSLLAGWLYLMEII